MQSQEGIVVRTYDYRETSLLVDVLTPDWGGIRMIARGARDPSRGMTAIFLPLNRILIHFYPGRNIHLLGKGELLSWYPRIRSSLNRYLFSLSLLEISFLLHAPEQRGLFYFLREVLSYLDRESRIYYDLLFSYFSLRVLKFAGFSPFLTSCVVCEKNSKPEHYSVELGGILCESCWKREPKSLTIDEDTRANLMGIPRLKLSQLNKIVVSPSTRKRIKDILYRHLLYRLEIKPPSLRFWEEIFGE